MLATWKAKKFQLESQLTVEPDLKLIRELSLVNYHIECTENRIAEKFKDPQGEIEYKLMISGKTYIQ